MANLTSLNSLERETYVRAKGHFERGEIEPALDDFSKLLESRENFADVHYMVGILLEQQGNLDSASESLRKALQLNPRYAEALLALSSILERTGRTGDYKKARELSERAAEASHVTGSDVNAITHAKLANLQAALGDAYAEVGELREAIDAYRKALDRCPDFHDIRHRLGVVLREATLPHQASLEFKRVLRGNPGMTDSRVQLGLTYYSLGRPQEAALQWEEAAAAEPERSDIRLYQRLLANVAHQTKQGGSVVR
jgi:tetratricopeptide (TPR) repeat protein